MLVPASHPGTSHLGTSHPGNHRIRTAAAWGADTTEVRALPAFKPLLDPSVMNNADWLERLGPDAYRVMREQGTERPFTSPFVQWEDGGVYHCKGCNTPLFMTENQFDAGCGWPSFDRPVPGSPIVERLDR